MTTTIENPPQIDSEVEALKQHNFDVPTAYELLDEHNINVTEEVFFVNEIKTISDLVTSGSTEDITKAQKYLKRFKDDLNWAIESDLIDSPQSEAIDSLLGAAIGDEGLAAIAAEEEVTSESSSPADKIVNDGVRIVSLAINENNGGLAEAAMNATKASLKRQASDEAELNSFLDKLDRAMFTKFDYGKLRWLDDVIEYEEPEAEETFEELILDVTEDIIETGKFDEAQAEEVSGLVASLIRASKAEDADKVNELFVQIQAKIASMTDDETARTAMTNELLDLVGDYVKSGEEESETEEEESEESNETEESTGDSSTEKTGFKKRLGKRWTALKLAFRNPTNLNHWKDVFSDDNGEHSRRNALVAAGIGAAAVATVMVAYRRGIDINPFDGDGINLNPFNNDSGEGSAVLAEAGETENEAPVIPVDPEIAGADPSEVVFVDAISPGDGVTHTAQDYFSQELGLNLTPDQMSQYWMDMRAQHTDAEISSWFPGSSVGGEWGVSYNAPGEGGLTRAGSKVAKTWATQKGLI